jgi:hypothetical protein
MGTKLQDGLAKEATQKPLCNIQQDTEKHYNKGDPGKKVKEKEWQNQWKETTKGAVN